MDEGAITRHSYRSAGVDIDAGDALVEAIKPLAKATARAGSEAGLGGFGALFDLKAAGYRDPVLVATTDGVGTKLKIAIASNRHDTVGIDLVAMSVNDLVVQGAEPLFFLDYFACGKLDPGIARQVIAGIARGCGEAGCALIGGETAEMPGMYAPGDYDLAGFAVGAIERGQGIDGSSTAPGDVVLGLESSGLHSNGFSLVRRIVETAGLSYDAEAPFVPGMSLAEALLVPTRLYVRACRAALAAGGIKAFAHITGGGLVENIPRVLPQGMAAVLDARLWRLPPVLRWLAKMGGLDAAELARTFNCGVGMVAIVAPEAVERAAAAIAGAGDTVHRIGTIARAAAEEPQTRILDAETQWSPRSA